MFTTSLIEKVLKKNLNFQKTITNCSIDSRTVDGSGLFLAFEGENVDGHRFVKNLVEKDVVCVGSRDLGIVNENYIIVEDVQDFMSKLAKERRKQLNSTVIALTGSSGKTSTRQFIVTMLELAEKRVYATSGNYNNHLGLPLTILNAPDDVDFVVLELGMNHSGEIEALTKIADPDISVINNIGTAHIGNFNSQRELASAKLELFDNTDKKVVADVGDKFIKEWVGVHKENKDLYEYTGKSAEELYELFPEQPGYMIDNMICAENVVKAAGIELQDRNMVLDKLKLPGMRGERRKIGTREFVVDCYNANPDSMKRSIDEFLEKYKDKNIPVYLILGSMFELGDFSKKIHRELVNYIKSINLLRRAFLIGCEFEKIKSDFLNEKKTVFLGDITDLFYRIPDDGIFLLKGSRGNKLERIIEHLDKEK